MRSIVAHLVAVSVASVVMVSGRAPQPGRPGALPTPGFHHLHLNSVNPEAAIAFYTTQCPSTTAGTFAGQPALRSPNDMWVLFTKLAVASLRERASLSSR